MKKGLILVGIMSLLMACQHPSSSTMIQEESIQQALTRLQQTYPNADLVLAELGVRQVAALWQEADGTETDFVELITTHYAATAEEKKVLYDRLSTLFEDMRQSVVEYFFLLCGSGIVGADQFYKITLCTICLLPEGSHLSHSTLCQY